MRVDHEVEARDIVLGLSMLILNAATRLESECHFPSLSGDEMDHKIQALKLRVERMRRIRQEFEDEMARPT